MAKLLRSWVSYIMSFIWLSAILVVNCGPLKGMLTEPATKYCSIIAVSTLGGADIELWQVWRATLLTENPVRNF